MSAISVIQQSFTGGEWAATLDARTDQAKYAASLATMRNAYPHVHGGASNRPGTEYTADYKNHAVVNRFYTFQFSTVQAYLLVFGDQNIRFCKDGGQIVSAKAITAASNASPINITSVAHGFQTGNTVTITGVTGNTAANGTWIITVTGVDNYTLNSSTGNGVYVSGGIGTAIVEVSTPYLEADLPLLKFEQSADVIYITHPSYVTKKLTRTSHTAWTLTDFIVGSSVTTPTGLATTSAGALVFAVTAHAGGVESAPSSTVSSTLSATLSWTAVTGADEYSIYQVNNGLYQFVATSITNSYILPSAITASTTVSAPQAKNPFPGTNDYPGCVAFFDQRLILGRTNNKPQSFNGSRVGDFQNFSISSPVQDDDAYAFTINSGQVNELRQMVSINDLILLTSGAEWRLTATGTTGTITPTSGKLTVQSKWGSSHLPPIIIGKSVLFVQASRKMVRDLLYTLGQDGYDGSELSILAQHLFLTYGIKEWAFQQFPDSIIWCVRDDGVLTAMTYKKEHAIAGWHRHDTNGTIETCAAVQNDDGTTDQYFGIKRTINGVTKRYIERLHTRDFLDIEDAFFVDCGLTFDGAVAQTLTPGTGATVVGTTGVAFTAGGSVFVSGDVGREIHYRYQITPDDPANDNQPLRYGTGKAVITGYTSGTVVHATIINAFPNLTAIAASLWAMSSTSISGLSHLEGKTVSVLANGNVVRDLVVSSGSITLPNPTSKAHIGLPYTSDLWTLGFDFPTRTGTVQDKIRSIPSVVLRLKNSRECFVGPDVDHLSEIAFRDDEDYGEPTRLFSGDKEVFLDPATDPRQGRVFIRVTDPLPVTVQAIMARIDHGDK